MTYENIIYIKQDRAGNIFKSVTYENIIYIKQDRAGNILKV